MGELLTHVLVVALSSYLLMEKKKINHPFMSELRAKSWLLSIHQHAAVSFPQINFTD